MPDEVFDSAVVLRECRFPGPPGPDDLERIYTEYLVPYVTWHEIVVQLIHNRGLVSWDVLSAVRQRLGLSELDFSFRLMLVVWAFSVPPARVVAPAVNDKPLRTAKQGAGVSPAYLGIDGLAGGSKTGDIVEKLLCIVAAHRRPHERAKKVLPRLVAEHPGLKLFAAFVQPALAEGGFSGFSAVQYSRLVTLFPVGAKTQKPARGGIQRKAGRRPRGQAGPKVSKTEAKIACLVVAAGGGDSNTVMKQLLADHPGRPEFLDHAGPILGSAGLKNFAYREYSQLRQRYAATEQPADQDAPKGRRTGPRISGNYRQKAQALARHNGWEASDSSVKRLMAQLRKSASNNAGAFREAVNEQADEAGIDRFTPEEADELFRLGEAPVPAEV